MLYSSPRGRVQLSQQTFNLRGSINPYRLDLATAQLTMQTCFVIVHGNVPSRSHVTFAIR